MSEKTALTLEELRRRAEESRAPIPVRLPKSGLEVMLRKPSALGALMASRAMTPLNNLASASPEDVGKTLDSIIGMLRELVVSPRISLNPGPTEIHPDWLEQDDVAFLLSWSQGVTGDDLARFPGGSRSDTEPGAGGAGTGL
jgi:hypothetical protein